MEANHENLSNGFQIRQVPVGLANLLAVKSATPAAAVRLAVSTDLVVASYDHKRQSDPSSQHFQDSFSQHSGGGPLAQVPTTAPGVSNCYVFKSRLQEYAQRACFPTPVYETIKEGPSHEPSFRSTVIVDGVRYDSLPGFFNRKAAEQSAAEVALMELSKCGENNKSINVPVHETGLCKNLLQEYAQKMNYAIPTYICKKDDTPGRISLFTCTVDIGGTQYIGAQATTRRQAEIKAARTALLAIRLSNGVAGQNTGGKSEYTVVPGKRKVPEKTPPLVETVKTKKRKKTKKKPRFKKVRKINHPQNEGDQALVGNMGVLASNDMSTTRVVIPHFVSSYGHTPHCLASSAQDNEGDQALIGNMGVLASNDMGTSQVVIPQFVSNYGHNSHSLASSAQDNEGDQALIGNMGVLASNNISTTQVQVVIPQFVSNYGHTPHCLASSAQDNEGDQVPASNMGVLANNDMGTRVVIQQFQNSLSDVQVSNYGHNPSHSLASSAQDNEGDQVPARNMGVLANTDMGTRVVIQQFQNRLSDVQVSNYGQTPHHLASSAQDNESSITNQVNGEVSCVKGGSGPEVSVNNAASSGQQHSAGNTDSSVPLVDANGVHAITDMTPMMNHPAPSGNLKALSPISENFQGDPPPTMADKDDAREENTTPTNGALFHKVE